jgi:DUF4097 and DUF4098 domain-containing protein YvlB
MLTSAIAALCVAQPAGAASIDKSIDADARGEVQISNVSGSVHVTGWDKPEVQVNAELGDDVERLDFKRDGEHVYIKVVLRSGRNHDGDAELNIRVPRDSRLSITTVSADQVIDGVRGAQRLQAVSGDIATQVGSGEFRAETVSGELVARGLSPEQSRNTRVRASSVSGSIILDNLGGDIDINTVSGDMSVRTQLITHARINTTNGSLKLAAGLARDAQIEAESINGDFSFNFTGTVDAEFDIETFNGDVENCFGPKPKRKHEHSPGIELRFKEGAGSGSVRIKTLNGEITLCRSQRGAMAPFNRFIVA